MSSKKIMHQQIMPFIDYACVSFETTEKDIRLAVLAAEKYGIKVILVNPIYVSLLKKFCKGKDINIASTAAFPIGAYPPEIKEKEIEELISMGVDEIYMLMDVGAFLDCNYIRIEKEMNLMVKAVKGKMTKYIIEAGLFNESQQELICNMAIKAGIDYIVTSANFVRNNIKSPTLADIKSLIRKANKKIGIISFSDIKSVKQMEELFKKGVSRICIENLLEYIF